MSLNLKQIRKGVNRTLNKIEKTGNKTINNVVKTTNQTVNQVERTGNQVINKLENTFDFNKRFDMPPNYLEYLQRYGNNVIVGATIYRHKVNSIITGALNVLSGNSFDRLYHLRCYFNLDNGEEIYIEKNERINCGKGDKQSGHHALPVNRADIPQGLTFGVMMQRTQELMGEKFLTYSASSNNCQYFIRAIFQANGMLRPNYESFIKQSTETIFKNLPELRKFANTVTDVAGEVNGLVQGGNLNDYHIDENTRLHCLCCNKGIMYKNIDKHNKTITHMKNKQKYAR